MVASSSVGRYLRLNDKYLREGEVFLSRGDLVQASEKFWGAMAQAVKAVAAKRDKALGRHRDLARFVAQLDREHPQWGLLELFAVGEALHTNFYEDHYPEAVVERYARRAREFVEKLKALL